MGLDLGTNSIGWAVVGRNEDGGCNLLDRGVHIFKDGVAHDQSGEKPAVQERTRARASRRHYFRRRLRKIELLKILSEYKMCPYLSDEELDIWRKDKKYPLKTEFLEWQQSDANDNPYKSRYLCLTKKLDLNTQEGRYTLGRALYHINQRRGFLSNRKEAGNEDEKGKVKSGITNLSQEIKEAGCSYLGEYFYLCYGNGKKIRTRYTARLEHYKKEFDAISLKQELPTELVKKLEKAIFFQRPLKSQKGSVGKCTFEKDKPRCPVSHPRFEEFRMWQFLNSVKVSYCGDSPRQLTDKEIDLVYPLFFRKSKSDFEFEDIAKKIAGKGNYSFDGDSAETGYKFNYRMSSDVSGCPVISAILAACGINPSPQWDTELCSIYTKADGKSVEDIINDIWHALFSFDDEEKLRAWLHFALQIDDKKASELAKSRIPQAYASLSLKAINKILPWMKRRHLYSEAVFLANIPAVLSKTEESDEVREADENVQILLQDFERNPLNRESNKVKEISDYLRGFGPDVNVAKLYHPSMIELYPKAIPDADGKVRLGSPRTNAFKNPMAMRALFRLRSLVNQLLDEDVIDPSTKINIEFARELNDSNKRKAIERYQRDLEKQRRTDRDKLIDEYKAETGRDIEPSDSDLLKYRLYEEQEHICVYTGKTIRLSSFVGAATEFDIEHTIPRSKGGDDSQMNKTLCESNFNRYIKKTLLPSELPNHEDFLLRIDSWKKKVEDFDKSIASQKRKQRTASTKEEKDRAIQEAHYLKMWRDYWKGKYDRFTMTAVPEGFSNRQGVDIGIIGKYSRMFLKTVFDKIYIVKGSTTSDFRKAWGLQREYEKKERVNHSHHCIDAVTIACVGRDEYDRWARYERDVESWELGKADKPFFKKPWPTFTEDVLAIPDSLIVSHYTPDNMAKQSRKKLRVRGVIQRNDEGKVKYCQGDTARRALHQDTFYGAIEKDGERKYVIRKALDSISEKDLDKIVDDVVKSKVKKAVERYGSLKKAVDENGIWMKEGEVPIRKVRLYATNIVEPMKLKKHRDLSDKDYKWPYYVQNDSNYCMAIYGDKKPSFKIFNVLEAAQNYEKGLSMDKWVPMSDDNGLPLRCVLKIGTMVLFYENDSSELYDCTQSDLVKRLYKVTGLSTQVVQRKYRYGIIDLKYHQEARPSSPALKKKGRWRAGESVRPIIGINHNQLTALVEGYDFDITTTGRITFRPHPSW